MQMVQNDDGLCDTVHGILMFQYFIFKTIAIVTMHTYCYSINIKPLVNEKFCNGNGLLIGCHKNLNLKNTSIMTRTTSLPSFEELSLVKLMHNRFTGLWATSEPGCVSGSV